jgi:two-component system chemotaxis response regulator CheY
MFPNHTKILALDDMPGMRQLVKGALKQLGFKKITLADNGKAGAQYLVDALKTDEPFNLVLSDWNMPDGSGIDLLQLVRSHPQLKDLPFLLVTADGEFRQVKRAMELKVTEFVVKPFTHETMKAKLENAWKKVGMKLIFPSKELVAGAADAEEPTGTTLVAPNAAAASGAPAAGPAKPAAPPLAAVKPMLKPPPKKPGT